jgi:demethylmenaquinone methyltransferase / 2-methoxy-6-polyprenyl-1,4-benzoquinol methylase
LNSSILDNRWMRKMFDSIPEEYIHLNKILTFGLDEVWRGKVLDTIKSQDADRILDACTGTGDLALKLASKFPNKSVYAVDFSPNMLSVAEKRARILDIKNITFKENDCGNMDFDSDYFNYITISFGFRNLSYSQKNLTRSLKEMYRVLNCGGRLIILETSQPRNMLIRKLFHFYARNIVPVMGMILSGKRKPYAYLGGSIVRFYDRESLVNLLASEGFQSEKVINFMFGMISLFIFQKMDNNDIRRVISVL